METPSTSVRDLAARLLAYEAAGRDANGEHESLIVCEKLRVSLTRFAGADSFSALMRRALALSRVEAPGLEIVKMRAGGCLEGLEKLSKNGGAEAGAAITVHLLWLLVTFIGEPIALRLVKEAWPDVLLGD